MNTIQIYETDFGTVILPSDFPSFAFRKNGTPDRRRKIAGKIQQYIDSLKEASLQEWQAGRPVRGIRAMSWADWIKTGLPNA